LLSLVAVVQTAVQPADAQDPFEPVEIVSRDPVSDGPLLFGAERSSISSLGDVVVFPSSRPSSTGSEIRFRDRLNAATAPEPPINGENPGLSDDGCVIGYTGDPVAEFTFALVRLDRCAGGSVLQVGVNGSGFESPTPGLSADGTTIAWSRRTNVLIWRQGADDIVVPAPNPGWVIGDVALSSDGNVIAFVSGPVNSSGFFVGDQTQVWVADVPAGATGVVSSLASVAADRTPIGRSFDPTISSDGTLIAFRGLDTVFVADRTIGFARPVVVGGRPSISRDGRYIAFEIFAGDSADIFVVRTSDRWTTVSPSELLSYAVPGGSPFRLELDADVSEHGRWVSWSTREVAEFLADPLFPPGLGFPQREAILVRQRRPVLSVDPIVFGPRSSPIIRDTSVRNVGPSGWRVTLIDTTGGPYQVVGQDCPAVLHPDDVCTVSVRYSPSGSGEQVGRLDVRDDSYPGEPLMASAGLSGENDPDGPPEESTTPATTTPGRPPTTAPPNFALSITPDPIVFNSTIVASVAPNRVATVKNMGDTSITVDAATISGLASGDYSIILDGCTSTLLAVGGSCSLTVGFAPSTAGLRTGDLSVTGTGGTSARTTLRGSGEFDAQLSVTPEVVAPGQVVMLVGSGFPPSTPIAVTLGEGEPIAVNTDGTGAFMMPWLVLGGTPQGELLGDDVAAVSVYDADPAPLLVVGISMRPQSTSTRNRDIRSHVSR
jgi:hypothetical protein